MIQSTAVFNFSLALTSVMAVLRVSYGEEGNAIKEKDLVQITKAKPSLSSQWVYIYKFNIFNNYPAKSRGISPDT